MPLDPSPIVDLSNGAARSRPLFSQKNVRFGPSFSALLIEKDEYENKSAVQIGDCGIDVI